MPQVLYLIGTLTIIGSFFASIVSNTASFAILVSGIIAGLLKLAFGAGLERLYKIEQYLRPKETSKTSTEVPIS